MRIHDIETQNDARLEGDYIHVYVNDVLQIEHGFADVEEGDAFNLAEIVDELADSLFDADDIEGLKRVSRILKIIRENVKERIVSLKEVNPYE